MRRGDPFAHAAFAIWDVGLPGAGPLGCRELRHRHSPALKQHGGPDQDSEGHERCDGGSDHRPEATTARKGRVRARVDLRWVGRRGTLPTACAELCRRRRSSVLEPTLSVLKLGVRTGPKCQSDEMASAAGSRVSGLALLTAAIRLGPIRRIGAITADVTARIGDGPLLARKRPGVRSRSDEPQTSVCSAISRASSTSMPRCVTALSSFAWRRSN